MCVELYESNAEKARENGKMVGYVSKASVPFLVSNTHQISIYTELLP